MKLAKQRGLVLITTLIFASVISLLILLNFHTSRMQWLMTNNQRLQEITFITAQAGITKIGEKIIAKKFDSDDLNPANQWCSAWQFLYDDKNCWQSSHIGVYLGNDYRYVVDLLREKDTRIQVEDKQHSANFYRVTVKATNKILGGQKTIIQATIVMPVKIAPDADAKKIKQRGWQSWRMING